MATTDPPAPLSRRPAVVALQMLLVRLRFLLVLAAALVIVGTWPLLRARWDKWARPPRPAAGVVSADTEFWCPMCPGVLSEYPGKCPVCNMALVRRKKGEAVPLPDGVLARMQLSPYRIQLAGIQTSPVAFLPLAREVVLAGAVAAPEQAAGPPGPARTWVKAEAFAADLAFLAEGQAARVACDLLPGRPALAARVRKVGPALAAETGAAPVWLEIEAPSPELRPGAPVTCRIEAPAAAQEWCRRAVVEEWQRTTAAELVAAALLRPAPLPDASAATALLRLAAPVALLQRGLVPALPESAVVDHGNFKIVYIETMPGMFDGVAATIGPRCGDHYPLLAGPAPGQRVATAGAFLIDAEVRLNPALAASYFGAARGGTPAASPPGSSPPADTLSPADREAIARQKICPVTGAPLDSMGGPVRVEVAGRTVFLCCEHCEAPLRKAPEKYLPRLAGTDAKAGR
jgi:Cu(I)/Ag(I) efflux system membrane fusion protein